MKQAIVAAGCFWCTEAVFQHVRGVEQVEPGYIGGFIKNPCYREICTGRTGHAEGIRITYDEEVISFREILLIFMVTHDPTQLNRQGADVGTQYRSAIFFQDEKEKQIAQSVIQELNDQELFSAPIVTTLEEATAFYLAEAEHVDYYNQHRQQPYCSYVIDPKLNKLRAIFASYLKE